MKMGLEKELLIEEKDRYEEELNRDNKNNENFEMNKNLDSSNKIVEINEKKQCS